MEVVTSSFLVCSTVPVKCSTYVIADFNNLLVIGHICSFNIMAYLLFDKDVQCYTIYFREKRDISTSVEHMS